MKVTYVHHSGFFVELPQVNLLFDYYTGSLPETDGKKPLAVFASHRHGDHFSEVIFQLPGWFQDVSYVLSGDIWERRVPADKREKTIFLSPGQETELDLSGRDSCFSVRIRAFRSTDEGVAFLLDCGGTVIYHAGDLNNWTWNGEPEAWNRAMAGNYHKELGKIRAVLDEWGKEIDAAFVPLDGRLEDKFYLGLDDFMKQVGAKHVFPMHCWDDYTVIGKLKKMPESETYRDRIIKITGDGDSFEIEP